MPLAEGQILRPIPRLPSPTGGRPFSLSQRERAGMRENDYPFNKSDSPSGLSA